MLAQILLSKRLFNEGATFARRTDPVSCGLATSLFQDAVEIFIWALIKHKNIQVKDTSSFTANLEAIEKTGIVLTDRAKIQELNKARVGFKHYGNLPAPDEARKFEVYAEDFLRSGVRDHFDQNFDSISLVDIVPYLDVRERLKQAESLITSNEFGKAIAEAAIAKAILFRRLEQHIPAVQHMGDLDRAVGQTTDSNFGGFTYIENYLGVLREVSLVTLLRAPLTDYMFLQTYLPRAAQFGDSSWRTMATNFSAVNEAQCRRAIKILVEMSIRLEGVI